MKHAFALVLSTTLLAGTAAFAQDYRREPPSPPSYEQRGHDEQRFRDEQRGRDEQRSHVWVRGERVPVELRNRDHIVVDWRDHHLRRPPAGYVWVRDRDRFLLVGKQTGRIAELAQVR